VRDGGAGAGSAAALARTARARPRLKVSVHRGELVPSPLAPHVMATVHPSAVLRAPDDETRRAETARLIADLARVAGVLA
jgi:uracil-DNA glycosylase